VQVVSLDDITQPNAFVVTGLPQILSVAPNSAQQGQTRTVVIAGENTAFTTGSTVSFGSGVTIRSSRSKILRNLCWIL
jgi:hypothetical protein